MDQIIVQIFKLSFTLLLMPRQMDSDSKSSELGFKHLIKVLNIWFWKRLIPLFKIFEFALNIFFSKMCLGKLLGIYLDPMVLSSSAFPLLLRIPFLEVWM